MIEQFRKCTFAEFLILPEYEKSEYERIGMLMKPDSWGVSDVMEWPYITVKEIQSALGQAITYQGIIDIITELTGQKKDKILSRVWIDVFKFIKFVNNSIERINEVEKNLAYEPDANEMKAGIEMFNQFGHMIVIDRLAGGDILKWEQVAQKPFAEVFTKLKINMVDNQFMKNYQIAISK